MKISALLAVVLVLCLAAPAFGANYYLSEIIGSCTEQDPCQPKVTAVIASETLACTPDNVANTVTHDWALTKVECDDPGDYVSFLNDAQIDVLPNYPFDGKMSAMASDAKNGIAGAITRYSITGSCDNQESYRLLIRCLGQQINQSWTEANWAYF